MYSELFAFTKFILFFSGCLNLTDRAAGKHKKWIMCPTCRQRTYLENVAFVVEKQSENADKQADDLTEAAISVQGSYGTKVSFNLLTYDRSTVVCFKFIVSACLPVCNNLIRKTAVNAWVQQELTFCTNHSIRLSCLSLNSWPST